MATFSEESFQALVARHQSELRLHCYRMLGSSHDSEDVLQEALLRAWRARDSLQDPLRARAWLYRIATNVCLDELGRRRGRGLPVEAGPPADPRGGIAPPDREAFIEPCPDTWCANVIADPAARYETFECVALAFVAALHHLTPAQRATLLLRDVVGLSAEETADALGFGLEATNSALFRARSAVEAKLKGRNPADFARSTAGVDALLTRYLRAWNELDVEAFVLLLHDEVQTTMPPSPTWIAGHADNAAFYRTMFAAQRAGTFRALPTAANGQPAFAFYRTLSEGEPQRLRAIQLVEVRDDAIVSIDHFMLPELCSIFGLPEALDAASSEVALDARPCVAVAADALRNFKG
jgi:RNA polymerase sigma-70 factor (ECF subfamily)